MHGRSDSFPISKRTNSRMNQLSGFICFGKLRNPIANRHSSKSCKLNLLNWKCKYRCIIIDFIYSFYWAIVHFEWVSVAIHCMCCCSPQIKTIPPNRVVWTHPIKTILWITECAFHNSTDKMLQILIATSMHHIATTEFHFTICKHYLCNEYFS